MSTKQARVTDNNDSFFVDHDRLPESELTNARSYLIYGDLRNFARIPGVGYGLLDRPHLDFHAACRRPAGHLELTILLTNFGALSLANSSRGPTRFKKLSGRTQGPIWDSHQPFRFLPAPRAPPPPKLAAA